MATTNSVPKPKNQGGHGTASLAGGVVQKKNGPVKPGNSTIEFGVHSAGHGGTNKTANSKKG
jgi:hypothetical protein